MCFSCHTCAVSCVWKSGYNATESILSFSVLVGSGNWFRSSDLCPYHPHLLNLLAVPWTYFGNLLGEFVLWWDNDQENTFKKNTHYHVARIFCVFSKGISLSNYCGWPRATITACRVWDARVTITACRGSLSPPPWRTCSDLSSQLQHKYLIVVPSIALVFL